jgi:type IV pilus assembly protein PilQ
MREIVTLDSSVSVANALDIIDVLSKQYAGKLIVDPIKMQTPIGMSIFNMPWRDAMEAILSHNGLWYKEAADYIQIITAAEAQNQAVPAAGATPKEHQPTLDDRDIKISAVFFNANVSKLQDYGISWNFFRPQQSNSASIGAKTSADISPTDLSDTLINNAIGTFSSPPSFTFANIDGLVKFFGSNELGEVITSPDLVVQNAKKGNIQIGTDFFITSKDFAGNTIQERVSTGTIIDVTPTTFIQNDTPYIALTLNIQQSGVNADKSINLTKVSSNLLLYDGEETVIGGLLTTTDEVTRQGVPFLMDLPPWLLGLRYLFGSDNIVKSKQELIILLRAELLPSIRGRYINRSTREDILEKKKREYQDMGKQ